ncbi:hypothetical protein PYW08_005730 [Mythimna loreyi]|uniref:Uncharacterized protein n=1 Tax=Mythimna loreyi TaxID=667449 RepID=A0ACC2QHT9_9NEOP|nr:hypothetical protein PYW08_005730 [Mythimna loreyi]
MMAFNRLCPRWHSDQNFGMCMPPHDFLYPFYDMHSSYFRPWKCFNSQTISKQLGSTIENEKGNYKITLDVQHYRPDDISVKVTETEIIVEAKHEERQDSHGFISRQFKRRYPLPSHCPAENVTSSMSSDGILIIIAEKKSSNETEKIVPIKMCGLTPKKTQIESKISSEIIQNSVKNTGDMSCSKDRTQILLKEDHSRLLRPELLKDTVSSTNGEKMLSKPIVEVPLFQTESCLSEKKDAMNNSATSNKIEESIAKSNLELSKLTEQLGQKNLASTSDLCGMKGMSNMSKTVIEESSSSYKSSSMMSSTMKTSGKIGGYVSDVITAELKEAAENI